MPKLLEVDQARFAYPQDGHGLQPLSLCLDRGQGVAISGPSGCGKSTLARCVSGLIPHLYHGRFEGKVLLDGTPVAELPLWQIVERVGLVFQNPATQMLSPSVAEEIIFGLENLGLGRAEIDRRVEQALSQFGLLAMRDRSPLTLSGGEQQKLALAAILARQPDLVVLDEPLSMLDSTATADLVRAMNELLQSGKALMICEHRQEYLQQIAGLELRTLEGCSTHRSNQAPIDLRPPATPESFRLQVRDVSVQLAGRTVLERIRFEAESGQILAVVGPNGAGKTTLLRALAGFQSFSGEIVVDSAGQHISPSFGIVFQNPDLQLFNASVRDEILYRVSQPNLALYEQIVAALGLSGYEQTPPLLLSEGEKRRLAMATVLMRQPVHGLLLDEPSLGQDRYHKAFLLEILTALKDQGMLVMMATHDLELAAQSDRVLLMEPRGLVGLTSGILAAFLGLGDFGVLNTLLSYTAVGVGVDLALLLLRSPENLAAAALIGALGHFGKFLVKWALGVLTGAPLGFVALGLLRSLVGYIVFGALGGVLGALTILALRKAGFFVYLAEKR